MHACHSIFLTILFPFKAFMLNHFGVETNRAKNIIWQNQITQIWENCFHQFIQMFTQKSINISEQKQKYNNEINTKITSKLCMYFFQTSVMIAFDNGFTVFVTRLNFFKKCFIIVSRDTLYFSVKVFSLWANIYELKTSP